jgi:hypothetical protein
LTVVGVLGALAVAAALTSPAASADVRRVGDWSGEDPEVSLDLDNVPRAEAINRLAAEAGWSVIVNAPKGDPVSVHVSDQPASKVLELLLADGRYVARRDHTLIAVAPDDGTQVAVPPPPPAPPPPPPPPPPPVPADDDDDSRDRTVTGGSLRIGKDEVVHDVTVMGGNLDVWGVVTGDLSVMGGNVTIHKGARVKGDAAAVGGALTVESGASVDGDVGVLGGILRREEGARIGGEIHEGVRRSGRHHHRKHAAVAPGAPHATPAADKPKTGSSKLRQLARDAAGAVNAAALLFVFGAVLLALTPDRMDRLRVQIAARPMRSFATGVVSLLAGIVLLVAVSVTIIGIPFAIVGFLAAVVATLAGVCSVLETVGCALLGHRTKNPYVHLAAGGVLFLVAGAIPFVGPFVKIAVFLTAMGSVVATRAAGLLPAKNQQNGSPYRQPDLA